MQFSQGSYKANNNWGIQKVTGFLESKGLVVKHKEREDYDVDIEAIDKEGNTIYFEVETKTRYSFTSMDNYRFPTVSFLARKEKWMHKPFWYIILCRETEAFLICHSYKIFKYEYKELLYIQTNDREGRDSFYRVPKEKCKFFQI